MTNWLITAWSWTSDALPCVDIWDGLAIVVYANMIILSLNLESTSTCCWCLALSKFNLCLTRVIFVVTEAWSTVQMMSWPGCFSWMILPELQAIRSRILLFVFQNQLGNASFLCYSIKQSLDNTLFLAQRQTDDMYPPPSFFFQKALKKQQCCLI